MSEWSQGLTVTQNVDWGFLLSTTFLTGGLISQPHYTGCPRRKGQNFGRVFLMLKYTDITQNTYIQSWTVTEIMAREKCGLLAGLRTVPCQLTAFRMSVLHCRVRLQKYRWRWTVNCLTVDNAVHGAAALWIVGMSCIVLGTLKDNYDVSAGFFVVQFNGFMSLTS